MKTLKLFAICLLFVSIASCSKDDDSNDDDIRQQVENFVTPDLIQSLEELGFNFNDGDDSPDISGDFLYSVITLKATNILNDSPIGTAFPNIEFQFSNLNPEQRQFSLVTIQDSLDPTDEVTNTFYSGNGNSFSAYAKLNLPFSGSFVTVLYAFSGTITEAGITNAQEALLMLNSNNIEGVIENGQGRLFIDDDNTAVRL